MTTKPKTERSEQPDDELVEHMEREGSFTFEELVPGGIGTPPATFGKRRAPVKPAQ